MSESFIQLAPDGTGKQMRAILRTVSGQSVYDEVLEIADPATGNTIDPRQIVGLDYITAGKTQPHIIPDGYDPPSPGFGNRLLITGPLLGSDTVGNSHALTIQGTGGLIPALQGFLGSGSLTTYSAAYAQADDGVTVGILRTRRDNNAISSNTEKVMTLPVRANAAAQAWTEGRVVPLSADLTGLLRSRTDSWIGSAAPTVGQKAMASSLPVAIASDQSPLPMSGTMNALIADPVTPTQQAGVTPAGQLRVVQDYVQLSKSGWGGGWGSPVGW